MQSPQPPPGSVVGALLILAVACSSPDIVTVERLPDESEPSSEPFEAEFPPVSESADIYDRESPYPWPHQSPHASRYVLFQDSTFELQHAEPRSDFYAWSGDYRRVDSPDSVVMFDFVFLPFGGHATGRLDGRRLHVEYEPLVIVHGAAAGDGAYVLSATGG